MIDENKKLFEEFKIVHDQYKTDKRNFQKQFNAQGKVVVDIMREYEDRLCSGMERGVYGKYSNKVSEKFWQRVKKDFPLIELVGVEITTA